MRRRLLIVLAAVAGGAAAAESVDPLKSPECLNALAALQAEEDKAAPTNRTDRPAAASKQIETLRRQAARACLGSLGDPPPPAQHYGQPAFTVPGAVVRTAPPPAPRLVPPPVPPPPAAPPVLTNCDTNGCWTSDGRWLQRLGPGYVGPRGACTVQGAMVQCP